MIFKRHVVPFLYIYVSYSPMNIKNPLKIKDLEEKLNSADELLRELQLDKLKGYDIPVNPYRSLENQNLSKAFIRKGLGHSEGQKKLLHDLVNIELQAMELGLRTLFEFSRRTDLNIPDQFFKELLKITVEESKHCRMCFELLKKKGGAWGDFRIHNELWDVALERDSILERLLKVHRYLEGSGLDSCFILKNKLTGVSSDNELKPLLEVLAHDELDHVRFGSYWFAYFCEQDGLSRVSECKRILRDAKNLLPKRKGPIQEPIRLKAGFLKEEVSVFRSFQKENGH